MFEPIYYVVNLGVVSSSMVFSNLVSIFLLMYCYINNFVDLL